MTTRILNKAYFYIIPIEEPTDENEKMYYVGSTQHVLCVRVTEYTMDLNKKREYSTGLILYPKQQEA